MVPPVAKMTTLGSEYAVTQVASTIRMVRVRSMIEDYNFVGEVLHPRYFNGENVPNPEHLKEWMVGSTLTNCENQAGIPIGAAI
jgi:hypothetical protein